MEIIKYPENVVHETFDKNIAEWNEEVRQLLPDVPIDLKVEFNNEWLIPDTGTGGFASSKEKIELSFDENFEDKEAQMKDLRASYFHECYHVVQGFTGQDSDAHIPAIDNAILEGAATRFETTYANADPGWSHYPEREKVVEWVNLIKGLPENYDWQKWKFYNPDNNERWIMYRSGVFVVDQALENSKLDIIDLVKMSAKDILALAELD
ncbi:MAG: DUF2268 domain-containing putative Zn-dependent protease [bacterium]